MAQVDNIEIIENQGIEVYSFRADLAQGDIWNSVAEPGFYFGVLTQGRLATQQDWGSKMQWAPNNAAHFCSSDSVETEHEMLQNGQLSSVFLRVNLDAAETLLGEDAVRLIERAKQSMRPYPCLQLFKTLSWQILGCPMNGSARKLYVISRALEMLSCLVENQERDRPIKRSSDIALSSADIERIHAARSILVENLASPPTVPDLARKVGVNTRKLNEGFAQLFGSTVYAFAKSQRLLQARLLLETGALNVAEVAHHMGYHPAHLSAEFRKVYGVSPSKVIPKRR